MPTCGCRRRIRSSRLSAEQKELLRRWIAEGAEFTEHWSFQPLPASVAVPPVSDATLAAADARSLRARAAGSRRSCSRRRRPMPLRLLRRVTLDLTGLPPTADECREFEQAAAEGFRRGARARRRSAAGQPRVRRAHGRRLARRGPLRRFVRLPIGPAQHAVAVPRLGRAGAQRQPAVRPVPHLAAGGRPAGERQRAIRFSPRHSIGCIA